MPPSTNLTGQMLIAMPGMGDARFDRSVILMCAHSSDGAMGLIVNKPASDVAFADLLAQLDIEQDGAALPKGAKTAKGDTRVVLGGPVESGRGFVVHSMDYTSNDSTLEVVPGIGMTATLDILEDIARGHGPSRTVLALGYSGWGPGQLEREIAQNGWLTCALQEAVIFEPGDTETKWIAALKSLGIDPLMLSADGGRA